MHSSKKFLVGASLSLLYLACYHVWFILIKPNKPEKDKNKMMSPEVNGKGFV